MADEIRCVPTVARDRQTIGLVLLDDTVIGVALPTIQRNIRLDVL
jgi:hypothetical protein